MAGAVPGQRLGQAAQHQIPVGLQHHVDEVDDDDAADIAQPQLAHDLLGGLQIVLGDGLLQVATRTGELAGVDVDDRHRLSPVDHQRAARGQPHLAVHRLGELFVDAVHGEHVGAIPAARRLVLGDLGNQFRCNGIDVSGDGLPGVLTGDDQTGEVLVEQVTDHLDQDIGLFVQRDGSPGLLGFSLLGLPRDRGPALLEAIDVGADLLFLHTLGGGADDDTGVGRHHLAQDVLEPLTFGIGQFAADAGGRGARHVDQVAAGQ